MAVGLDLDLEPEESQSAPGNHSAVLVVEQLSELEDFELAVVELEVAAPGPAAETAVDYTAEEHLEPEVDLRVAAGPLKVGKSCKTTQHCPVGLEACRKVRSATALGIDHTRDAAQDIQEPHMAAVPQLV